MTAKQIYKPLSVQQTHKSLLRHHGKSGTDEQMSLLEVRGLEELVSEVRWRSPTQTFECSVFSIRDSIDRFSSTKTKLLHPLNC